MEFPSPYVFALFILLLLFYPYYNFWWKPESYRRKLRRQGITGPAPSIVLGNIPEMKQMMVNKGTITSTIDADTFLTVFPYFKQWTRKYVISCLHQALGQMYMFELGCYHVLYVTNPEMVRKIKLFRSLDLGKPAYLQKERGALLGRGLITTNGAVWSHQRKTLAPLLYMNKIKNTLNLVVESASVLIRSWERIIESEGGIVEIMVDDHVRSFTSYIFSNMMFGDDHHKGMKIFPKCQELISAMGTATTLGVPFLRFLPTKGHRQAWRLAKEIHSMIMDIAKQREGSSSQDMLQVILEASKTGELGSLTREEFVVDNCKDMFLAAFEVTAIAAIWGLMLLASNPEWQARARDEVQEVCGRQVPDSDMLGKMKVLKMVIQEVLRLYPGVAFVSRQAVEDVKLGGMQIPKGVNIWVWMLALHRDPELWGPDADDFNPGRFANGVSGACKCSEAYIPFGVGSRLCPGQSLAMTELMVLFAMILSNFSLTLSPSYRHSPKFGLLLSPEYGVNLLIQKI